VREQCLILSAFIFIFSQTCQKCGAAIEPSHFRQEKLQKIQASIYNTLSEHHPESFETFLQFLQNNKDFNYVVDGMWILHQTTRGNATTSEKKRQAGTEMKVRFLYSGACSR
jgi:hypothetical protein